ncbi:hypothetical protein [Desulfobulbus propionicus]
MTPPKQRRRLLINSRYQLRNLAVILTANLVLMLLIAVLISMFYLLFFRGNLACDHNRLFPLYLGGLALAVMLLLTLWSLYRSRSVAGMMRKIELVLAGTAQGHLPEEPLAFRKDDYFATMAVPINGCIARMRRQDQQRLAAVQALRRLQGNLADRPEERGAVQRHIETIIAGLENPPAREH